MWHLETNPLGEREQDKVCKQTIEWLGQLERAFTRVQDRSTVRVGTFSNYEVLTDHNEALERAERAFVEGIYHVLAARDMEETAGQPSVHFDTAYTLRRALRKQAVRAAGELAKQAIRCNKRDLLQEFFPYSKNLKQRAETWVAAGMTALGWRRHCNEGKGPWKELRWDDTWIIDVGAAADRYRRP